MTSVVHSADLEASVLGAVFVSEVVAPALVNRYGVRPEHFHGDRHRHVMAAVCALVDRGAPVDLLAVVEQLRRAGALDAVGGQQWIERALMASPHAAGSLRQHAADLKAHALWRNRQTACLHGLEACARMDTQEWIAAEARMTSDLAATAGGSVHTSEQAANAFLDQIDAKPEPRIPAPLPWLTRRMHGGFRRGQITVIIGPGHQGKSVLCDMAVQAAAQAGFRTGLYVNEMTSAERVERFAARMSRVGMDWISGAAAGTTRLSESHAKHVSDAMARFSQLPLHLIDASGWHARDVVRHAAGLKVDFLAFDILQRLPYEHAQRRRDMDEAMGCFDQFAKRHRCHVLLVSHINRERTKGTGEIPQPLMSDVMESKLIVDIPDNVIAFWREQDSDKNPTDSGGVKLLKGRGSRMGGVRIDFDGAHQVIREVRSDHLEVAA